MAVESPHITAVADDKIVSLSDLRARIGLARGHRRVVHCHGVFDLLHIGHIRHLQRARRLGDLLVVTVTPNRYVNKGPDRPAFDERLRAEAIAALDCVDLVAVNRWPTAIETIGYLRPDCFVKGAEYRDPDRDVTGAIAREREAVESIGGRLEFTDELTSSSSRLINRYLSGLSEATRRYLTGLAQRHDSDEVLAHLDRARELSALVIGEAIVDEYQYCQAIGKSSKEPVLTVRQNRLEKHAGGILAVANQVAGFAGRTTMLTMIGAESDQARFVERQLRPAVDAVYVRRRDAPTIVKRRYIDGYFFQKLFEVYEGDDAPLNADEAAQLNAAIAARAPEHDLVVVNDYGHGMIGRKAADEIVDRARFLALNVQCNAGNLGYHTVSKYRRADLICVAENEIRVEGRNRHGALEPLIEKVSRRLDCPQVIITRGSRGCVCYDRQEGFTKVPAVAGQVRDRMGAGDAFVSVAALCAARGAPLELAGMIGNAAGAEAVATVGHRRPIDRARLCRHIECLLK